MTKEKIIEDLAKRLDRNKYLADYFAGDDSLGLWDFYRGKVEGLQIAKCLVEAMHDDEYWNNAIADAIAMGDR